jgi:hypothetical protein
MRFSSDCRLSSPVPQKVIVEQLEWFGKAVLRAFQAQKVHAYNTTIPHWHAKAARLLPLVALTEPTNVKRPVAGSMIRSLPPLVVEMALAVPPKSIPPQNWRLTTPPSGGVPFASRIGAKKVAIPVAGFIL